MSRETTSSARKDAGITIVHGDARHVLQNLPEASVQCCVTSPPYWGLRDYGHESQIGAESTVPAYVASLVGVMREVRRVLREDGTLWLNLGDCYTSGGRRSRGPDPRNRARAMRYRAPTPEGLKPKDLVGVPWRVAFALQADGWYLRSEIIWHKPNCQPESVRDRPVLAHETLFLLSKSKRYYYDKVAVRQPTKDGRQERNLRSVWEFNAVACPGAPYSAFPRQLVHLCILAGSPLGGLVLDPFFGSGTVGAGCILYGRRCVGIELKQERVLFARQRLEQMARDIVPWRGDKGQSDEQ